jgi:hypothetical protein
MQGQSTPSPAEEDAVFDGALLTSLLAADGQRPWTVEEVEREMGDRLATTDSLMRLHRAGLIHRLDGYVFATRAALRGSQLVT